MGDNSERIKNILKKFGRRSVDPSAVLPGRRYFWYGRKTFIAYLLIGKRALVSGGPVGLVIFYNKTLREFLKFCSQNGWSAIFFNIAKDELALYRHFKLKAICIGMEAVINLKEFSFGGKKKKPLRYSQNIMEKMGYTAELLRQPLSVENYQQLKTVSDNWLETKTGAEKRFLSTSFSIHYLESSEVMVLRNPQNGIEAFVNFVYYGGGGIGIDLMRQKPNLPSDAMLFLITKLIIFLKERKYRVLSLGIAPLYGIADGQTSPLSERVLKLVFNHFSRLYNFKGLWVFKSKFMPGWQPKYLVFTSYSSLIKAVPSLIKASSERGLRGEIIAVLKKRLRKIKSLVSSSVL